MIEKIAIQNFKALRSVEIELQPITLFIGPNGSGKSSVLQVLQVMKQSIGSGILQFDGPFIRLGSLKDVSFRGNVNNEIVVELTGQTTLPSTKSQASYFYEVQFQRGRVIYSRAKAQSAEGGFVDTELTRDGEGRGNRLQFGHSSFEFRGTPEIAAISQSYLLNLSANDRPLTQRMKVELDALLDVVKNDLKRYLFVPAFRGVTSPSSPLRDGPSDDIVESAADSSFADNLASTLAYRRKLERRVTEIINPVFGREIVSELTPVKNAAIMSFGRGIETNVVNEGSGLNQSLFPVTQFAIAPRGSLIAIEEPEVHLHPKSQSELIRVLGKAALDEGKRLIITTHSEHILFGILSLVARRQIKPSDVAVYQFIIQDEEATCKRIEVTERGTLGEGLRDFFEANVRDLMALLGGSNE